MARLIVIKGTDEGKQFELPERTMGIGRDRVNPICLHDTEISRRHAEISPVGDGTFRLHDVGSANGTLVNTRPTLDAILHTGDHIQVGQTILVFSPSRVDNQVTSDLADRIRMVSKQDIEMSSAIVKTINENAGSMILARPEKAGTQWLKDQLANLSIMYATIQAVSHILDLDQLLDKIMELIFGSIEADHGCIMLKNTDTGAFEPKAVRVRDGLDTSEQIVVSRTIMDYVLREKQGVLISDAGKDDRFSAGASIKHFKINEAICVPMKGRHETHGVLFLDTISSIQDVAKKGRDDATGKFTEEQLALAIAIAHQAALAVEETRYHHALVNSERLAAIGQTIAALSHHIKNIMQGIVFGSDMVRSGLADKDENMLHKGWKLVEKNQGKIHELVMDMLSFSKEREPSIEMSDLNHVVEEVIDVVQGRAEQMGVNLEVRLPANLPPVPCDPDGIHKALLNIISNALDAVAEQEDLYVGVQTLIEPGGEWARIVVVDRGTGIDPEKINEIFRPFVSTKGSRGTGLGLPVSRKIFREHGGDIIVESILGKGSKFIMRLPMKSPFSNELNQTMQLPAFNPERED
ncbi:MAG: FHA domain-containing protein [Planctomycetes bacterium]|nr:FHA domain-containing protein [Planctomycetota bacterium]